MVRKASRPGAWRTIPIPPAGPLASPTDKMHNLQPIPLGQRSTTPLTARNNIPILFDSQPIPFEPEFSDQVPNLRPRYQLRKFTRLAINDKVHDRRLSPLVTQPRRPRPQKPPPYAAQSRFNLATRKINRPIERFEHLDRFDPWISVPQPSLRPGIRSTLIRQVFNRVPQDLDRFTPLRGEPPANARSWGRSKLQSTATKPVHRYTS
jgi:hypothetical protein